MSGVKGVFASAGSNYATECVRVLGLPESEGVLRCGLVHHHGNDDVDQILQALADL